MTTILCILAVVIAFLFGISAGTIIWSVCALAGQVDDRMED